VVDDDAAVLRTTVRLLDSLGFKTVGGSSGAEALQLLGTGIQTDVVVADLAMSEMSGTELVRTIRADYPTLPIILATGCRSHEIPIDLRDDQILQKPFADEELVKKIVSVLP
jgi:CheY-like chemotaxis protein